FRSDLYGPSVLVFLLPYIEQDNAYKLYHPDESSGSSPGLNDDAARVRPSVLLCPSDPRQGKQTALGWTNYHVNYGTWVDATKWDGPFGPNFSAGGAPGAGFIKIKDIADGTTNTAAFAEVANAIGGDTSIPPKDKRVDCFEYGSLTQRDPVAARTALLARNW